MRSLVWFRSDLRVADNTALHAAAAASDRGVIGAFLLSPTQWRAHDVAPCKVDFILRSVQALSDQLSRLRIPLLLARADRFSDAPRTLLQLATTHRCDAVFYNQEYEFNERKRDEDVASALNAADVSTHSFHDQTVFAPSSIRTGQGTFYTVFTPFKKAWQKHATVHGLPRALPPPRKQAALAVASDPVPLSIPGFESDIASDMWPAGEDHARNRLREFARLHLRDYAATRNTPAAAGTSTLSPYLAIGSISPRQCLEAVNESSSGVRSDADAGAATWVSELIWREFYRHILVGFPRVCMHRPFKLATESIVWNDDQTQFAAWCEGKTGFPIVDAGIRQLTQTGWMHNRSRMITAMFLTKDLFIDWRRGEQFFMQHLIDGDLASNNGGWQWSASTGTDSVPYFRIFNPTTQSRTNDPGGEYIRRYLPELASLDVDAIHDPPALLRASLGYPMPIVDHELARARVMREFKRLAGH